MSPYFYLMVGFGVAYITATTYDPDDFAPHIVQRAVFYAVLVALWPLALFIFALDAMSDLFEGDE